ncbi:porin family protein [Massilia sp. IC2-476]|uniref:porin family protein n=1 Tax=Massilia sp. IC2-476 TaxID=2887199 RepID=UPI001D105115|nr:porin family protein [Massilia sp. IC2-476]MCC2971656.1 porin family protein [Massilia sp. IC2-476]
MNKRVSAILLALPLFASLSAHAAGPDDTRFYAGIATGQSKSTLENPEGERFSSKNHPLRVKLYGGLALSEHLALEAGYAGVASRYKFDRDMFDTAQDPRLASRALYAAVKGSVAVSDKVSLHAKLGVAHSRFEMSNAGQLDGTVSDTKPMFGVGASYKLTENVAATLEFEHYGTVREKDVKLSQRQLQAGLRFGF